MSDRATYCFNQDCINNRVELSSVLTRVDAVKREVAHAFGESKREDPGHHCAYRLKFESLLQSIGRGNTMRKEYKRGGNDE